ncbi:MAG: hemagglutinin [Burkholderiaceae bacterium]|jgi:hypothetical protein|nr:hemagglutinin [Burkholderiaceae bacterium]
MALNHHHYQALGALGTLALALGLAGCGGGSGGGGTSPGDSVATQLTPACTGTNCGAASASTYAGQGIGVWSYANGSPAEQTINVGLSGLGSKPVTLVYTNTSSSAVTLPGLTLTAASGTAPSQSVQPADQPTPEANQIPERVRDFKPRLSPADMQQATAPARAIQASASAVGDQRNWFIDAGSASIQTRSATLRRQTTVTTPTGTRTVNLWLEDGEYGAAKVSDALMDNFLARFASGPNSAYSLVTGLAGQPWGPQPYSNLIDADQPLDIVLVNFVPDSRPYGLLGYFWSLNNYKVQPNDAQYRYSNASLSFYMDTETLYLAGDAGVTTQTSTLAHEFLHMVNFYQRGALKGTDYMFDTFLEEMTALMSEDILADRLTPGTNPMRDTRIRQWMAQPGFNCDLASWQASTTSPCFGYSIVGSLGAYLLRQHGIGFYRQLLQNTSSTDSLQVLGNAIAQAGGPSLPVTLQRWGANIALLPPTAPSGFGWPARSELGYSLPAIDGQLYAQVRKLPATVPAQLAARAHFPFVRQPNAQGVYQEQLRIPPGTTLTAIVQ